ncbi:hypothetical protein RYH80_00245 [Halobaculum sp. MBLA0147]|uniref:hypothetical protein n=1 Tax=Halobaculum sp. MBLA0147 TaxID=3079934 RepID=UPI003523C888
MSQTPPERSPNPTRIEDDPQERRDAAIRALIDREPNRAGDLYTLAARGTLAGLEGRGRGYDTLGADASRAGWGLGNVILATFCYRAAGRKPRATTRATEGIAIATDYRDSVLQTDAERACAEEYRGVFGVAGGIDTGGFDRAEERYESVETDDPVSVATGAFFEGLRTAVVQTSRHTPAQFEWDDMHGGDTSDASYLAARPRFLRRRLPKVLEHVESAGRVAPPRATTEHNNDKWRCPDCGQSEAHWVASEVICLDCDVRMVEK